MRAAIAIKVFCSILLIIYYTKQLTNSKTQGESRLRALKALCLIVGDHLDTQFRLLGIHLGLHLLNQVCQPLGLHLSLVDVGKLYERACQ